MSAPRAPFTTTFSRLLSPIAEGSPAGESLRYEGTYDTIAALRTEDDPTIDPGVWQTDLRKADWPRVEATCVSALETRSKDLQIAAWLVEAWLRQDGFAGLAAGLSFVADLCDTFWDQLYPEVRDGDLDFRLGPLFWIDEKLTIQVRLVPITAPASEIPAFTLSDWRIACLASTRPPRKRDPKVTGPTLDQFQQSLASTPAAWRDARTKDVLAALAATEQLRVRLDARCGAQAPSFERLRTALEEIVALDRPAPVEAEPTPIDVSEERHEMPPPASPTDPPRDAAPAVAPARTGPIATRADAYQRLTEVAEFLERTEPHSPVPRLVRRAIAWGGMTLEAVLAELVRDEGQLTEIGRLLKTGNQETKK